MLSYAITLAPTKGTITSLNAATGAFTYVPSAGITGTDTFRFKASDGVALSNAGRVDIQIR